MSWRVFNRSRRYLKSLQELYLLTLDWYFIIAFLSEKPIGKILTNQKVSIVLIYISFRDMSENTRENIICGYLIGLRRGKKIGEAKNNWSVGTYCWAIVQWTCQAVWNIFLCALPIKCPSIRQKLYFSDGKYFCRQTFGQSQLWQFLLTKALFRLTK